MTQQLTKEQAIRFSELKLWEDMSYEEIVKLQLFQEKLCLPFDKFHEAIEKVLKRPVWTHEFADVRSLKKEYLGEKQSPSFEEIINMIPEEKRILITMEGTR